MQKIIYLTSEVKGSKEEAFDYFLNAKYAPEAIIETKVGGKYETYWNPPEREDNSTIGCKITALEKNKLLAFEWKGPVNFKEFMNTCDPLTHVTIFFSEVKKESEKFTKVNLLHQVLFCHSVHSCCKDLLQSVHSYFREFLSF